MNRKLCKWRYRLLKQLSSRHSVDIHSALVLYAKCMINSTCFQSLCSLYSSEGIVQVSAALIITQSSVQWRKNTGLHDTEKAMTRGGTIRGGWKTCISAETWKVSGSHWRSKAFQRIKHDFGWFIFFLHIFTITVTFKTRKKKQKKNKILAREVYKVKGSHQRGSRTEGCHDWTSRRKPAQWLQKTRGDSSEQQMKK